MNPQTFQSRAEKAFSSQALIDEKQGSKYIAWSQCDFLDFQKASSPFFDKKSLPKKKCLHRIVIVGGQLSLEHSFLEGIEEKIMIYHKEEANELFSSLIQSKENQFFSRKEISHFELWNAKEASKGLFLYIPPYTELEKPIEILEVFPEGKGAFASYHMMVFGKQSHISFYHHVLDHGSSLLTSSWDLHLESYAKVKWIANYSSLSSPLFSHVYALLKRESNLDMTALDKGSWLLKKSYEANLFEPHAKVSLKGLSLVKGKKQSHVFALVNHKAPECESNQHFKTILKDSTRASFIGKIFVEPLAQKTQAYQLSNQLLLSERAQGFARPQLEIFADDVKASHGATVSKVNQEELFYLRSRGLSLKESEQTLLKGFCNELLESFSEEIQQDFLKDV